MVAHSAIKFEIPMDRWTVRDWMHFYEFLRIFGCPAYVAIPSKYRIKHQTKAWKGIYVGIGENGHSFKIYHPEKRKTYDRRNVTFDEGWIADRAISKGCTNVVPVPVDITADYNDADYDHDVHQAPEELSDDDDNDGDPEEAYICTARGNC